MHQLEVLVADPVLHVPLSAGEEIVHDYDLVSGHHQTIHQVGTDETSSARHQYSLSILIIQELHRREVFRHTILDRRLQMLQLAFQFADMDPRLLDIFNIVGLLLFLGIVNFLRHSLDDGLVG